MNREHAREIMGASCHVCPVCDGRACSGLLPGMGSAGNGQAFIDNVAKLSALKLRIKVLSTTRIPDPSIDFLGFNLSFPVLGAPVASVDLNMGGSLPEETYIHNVLSDCRDAGILGSTGDGLEDRIHRAGFQAIQSLDGHGIPFIKPWEDERFDRKLQEALDSGARLIGIDVDAIGLTILRKFGMATRMRTHTELRKLIERIPVPVILKGIMTPEEALLAIDVGADAIVVSNHGGRLTDAAPATIEVLPGIAQAVSGQVPIIMDGGIRTGEDILRVLASGADLAMIGRPFAIASLTDPEKGLAEHLQGLKDAFEKIMILTGCHDLSEIGPHLIQK